MKERFQKNHLSYVTTIKIKAISCNYRILQKKYEISQKHVDWNVKYPKNIYQIKKTIQLQFDEC